MAAILLFCSIDPNTHAVLNLTATCQRQHRDVLYTRSMTELSPASFRIRPAYDTDVPALRKLACETFPMACPSSITAEDIAKHCDYQFNEERLRNHLTNFAHYLAVAEDTQSGQLLGYLLLIAGAEMDPAAYEKLRVRPSLGVDKLYVRAEYHGSGISRALMDHAVEQAFNCGYSSLWLGTNSENKRALRFYEKQSFEIVGSRTYYVGTTQNDDVVLEKLLVAAPLA